MRSACFTGQPAGGWQGMPPFWGRTDREIFGRVLREPLDLVGEPWGEVSAPAKDLVVRCLLQPPAFPTTTIMPHHHLPSTSIGRRVRSALWGLLCLR